MQGVYHQETEASLEEVCREIEAQAAAYKFTVLSVWNVNDTLKTQRIEVPRECRVIEICSSALLQRVLQSEPSLLPLTTFQICVSQESQTVRVSTIMRHLLADAIGNPELRRMADSTDVVLKRIIESACRPRTRLDSILNWNMC